MVAMGVKYYLTGGQIETSSMFVSRLNCVPKLSKCQISIMPEAQQFTDNFYAKVVWNGIALPVLNSAFLFHEWFLVNTSVSGTRIIKLFTAVYVGNSQLACPSNVT